MKALLYERSLPRIATSRLAGAVSPGMGSRFGALRLVEAEEPELPGPGWQRVRPLLSGICGSDLSTVDGHASRWFEPIVSFPFVPGHEVVGVTDDDRRVVVEPVLGCTARGIDPPCPHCAVGDTGRCERVAFGHLAPGLQTGYCADTGGGWGGALVAHASQLHAVPDALSDEAAVMVEPAACAVHGALAAGDVSGAVVAVLGAGTLGLCTLAALRRLSLPGTVIIGAKYADQRTLAGELGATVVADPGEVRRAVRRTTRSLVIGDRLTGGADVVIDCVGSADSLAEALAVVRPRGRVVLVGMPGELTVDLTPLWQREVQLVGAYAYGAEESLGRRTFDVAMELVHDAGLERLVSARYPLERYVDAIEHAATAGRRGAVKVVFDQRRPLKGRRRAGVEGTAAPTAEKGTFP
ncbi:MAG TPA: zinc-binding dehydrogenase [Acidimicrobiales bacterium]